MSDKKPPVNLVVIDEVPALMVAAELADAMVRKTQQQVVADTGVPLEKLLNMIELKLDFDRHVLRYLGFKRAVRYYRD